MSNSATCRVKQQCLQYYPTKGLDIFGQEGSPIFPTSFIFHPSLLDVCLKTPILQNSQQRKQYNREFARPRIGVRAVRGQQSGVADGPIFPFGRSNISLREVGHFPSGGWIMCLSHWGQVPNFPSSFILHPSFPTSFIFHLSSSTHSSFFILHS